MFDYGWRQYLPDLGRWNGIDQLAESYLSASPYAYVLNNPINMFDPDGRKNEAWLSEAPLWLQEMWNATPDGTNSYWFNNGSGFTSYNGGSSGGGGSGLAYNSTVSYGGTFTMGDWTYAMPPIVLTGNKSGWAAQFRNHMEKYGNVSMVGNMMKLVENASNNWYSLAGKGNWFFGTAGILSGTAGVIDSHNMYSQGIRRGISGNYQLKGRNLSQFGKMAMTDATKPVSKIARGAKIIGHASFYLGVAFDGIGVINYINNPNSPNAVHPGKAVINTGFGALGNWGGTIGASLSTVYFGVDNFYPGGWPQLFDDANMVQGKLDEGFNQAGPYRINVFGAHEPK